MSHLQQQKLGASQDETQQRAKYCRVTFLRFLSDKKFYTIIFLVLNNRVSLSHAIEIKHIEVWSCQNLFFLIFKGCLLRGTLDTYCVNQTPFVLCSSIKDTMNA